MAFARCDNVLSPYRKFLVELSSNISGEDLETLKFAVQDLIPRGKAEDVTSGLKFFDILEQDSRITPSNLSLLDELLKTIGRMDLAWKVQCFAKSPVGDHTNDIQNEACVTDGPEALEARDKAVPTKMSKDESQLQDDAVAVSTVSSSTNQDLLFSTPKSRKGKEGSSGRVFRDCAQTLRGNDRVQVTSVTHISSQAKIDGRSKAASRYKGPASASTPFFTPSVHAQMGQGQLHLDSTAGPPPVGYVNHLAYQGYSVEIIGGKHYKTPDGEFVELKSGTQYKIQVKNSHVYGCNLDISIDGYDVGGWVVYGGEDFTIERPAYEAKKFTFYRVKTAPKEAGIEPGRDENGLVKCVFTPAAFLDIPVAISGLLHPLKVNIALKATVGDLKRQVQRQLNAAEDPCQFLVLNDEVLSNSFPLRNVVKSPGNLRLIDSELEVTVEASSCERFLVKIRQDKTKVIDLMAVVAEKLEIPVEDQKVYHGRTRLSDAPQTSLPSKLICDPQPTVVVIVPEYITITVEDVDSGEDCIMKVDKAKTLKDFVDEIPLCRNLQENEKATFHFKGEELCPSKTGETLSSLGFSNGSKLELKREEKTVAPTVPFKRGVPLREEEDSFLGRIWRIMVYSCGSKKTQERKGAMASGAQRK